LTQKTKKQHQERYAAKPHLVRILYQRHWEKQRIIDLLYIADRLMQLPDWLNSLIWQELENASSGVYHGYPMPDTDPFARQVLLKWSSINE